VDGPAKVTGKALYVDDLRAPGLLHGATLRSTVPRGRLLAILPDPAFDWSGLTVITAADIPHNVVALIEDDQPVLVPVGGEIRHRSEALALVAGEDRERAARAVEHLGVEVEPLPAVLSIAEALAARVVIHRANNVQKRYRIVKGDGAQAVSRCEVVVTGTYRTPLQEQLYLEPQGVLAWWEDGKARLTGSLQCPYYVEKGIERTFGLSPAAIDVTQAVTGGGFGGKEEYPTLLALHALLLARKSGRPVKMVYGRQEDIEATTKRHPAEVEITTGCDRDGTFRAASIRVVMDGGAYVTLTPVVLSRGTLHASGAYRWRHVSIESCAVATNTPPNGAFRGFGAPQTIWAMERHVDRIARTLGVDPLELRRKNLLRVGDTTATGQHLADSVGVAECVARATAASGYHEKRARGPARDGRKVRGIGASVFFHGAGFTGSGEQKLKGTVAVDLMPGGRARVRSASTDIGQGTETVFRQIAAAALGVSIDEVDVSVPSTAHVPDSGPTVASRTVMVVGSLVEKAAQEIRDRVAGERTSRGGSFAEAGDRLLVREGAVSAMATYAPPPGVRWDDATYTGDAYPVFGWACDVAEVEVDLDTFETKVVAFCSAVDVGRAIHPVMCRGQIEGGTLQAIGWALSEEVVTAGGQILNPRMTDYIVPTSLDAPPFTTILVEHPYAHGPGGGAKGLGELPMDGAAPAIASAVEHATGLVADTLPLLPELLFELAQGAKP
jgi:CO/xanthine dehydrogenase Mo-binding subunit